MDHWVNQREKKKWKHDDSKLMGHSKSSSKRTVNDTSLPQAVRKISNKQPNLISKATSF